MHLRTLLPLTALLTTVAAAQDVQWKLTTVPGLVATDDQYFYGVKTTAGIIGDTMFTVTLMTKPTSGSGLSAFCYEYSNLGRVGTTLLVEKKYWNIYLPAGDFKLGQITDSLKKNTPNDTAFALNYACLDMTAQQKAERQTLSIPDGTTIQLPYPALTLKATLTGTPDLRIITKISQ